MEEPKKQTIADIGKDSQYQAKYENEETKPDPIDDGLLLYNVSPKTKSTEKIIPPNQDFVKVEGSTQQSDGFSRFWQTNKLYIILFFAVCILGPAMYFGFSYFFNKPIENNLLNPKIKVVNNKSTTTPKTTLLNSNNSTPTEWQKKYFGNESCSDKNLCGDEADPDKDGLINVEEFKLQIDPNNPDSDSEGLADGDEVYVFSTDPTNPRTASNVKYNDADYIKGGFDPSIKYDPTTKDKKFTPDKIAEISEKIKFKGLHQPTLTTLGETVLNNVYNYVKKTDAPKNTNTPIAPQPTSTTTPTSTLPSNLDVSLEAKQDRDAQRSDTIKKILVALVSYNKDNQTYPKAKNFSDLYKILKPYLLTATNPQDPINTEPYIYTYVPNADLSDFTITFYSEVAREAIKKNASDAQKEATAKQAGFYDDQRKQDMQLLQSSLLLYSQDQVSGTQEYVFPTEEDYKKAIVPNYISEIPKDPKTEEDYEYTVSETFDTFTLKSILDAPKKGTTGWLCNQDECREY